MNLNFDKFVPNNWRQRLSTTLSFAETQPGLVTLSVMGLCAGVLAGLAILALHACIAWFQDQVMGRSFSQGTQELPLQARILLPICGALIIGISYRWLDRLQREGGIVHVMERLYYHQGQLPIISAVVQFFGSAVAIATGQSVGREGTAAHVGAATSSWLGQRLEVPNASTRILVAAGTAGGIAASFNTPLAAVIFAMEVVLLEYHVAGFAPIILAAVAATTVTQFGISDHPMLIADQTSLSSLVELPYLVFCGVVIGGLAIAFMRLTSRLTVTMADYSVTRRMLAAGVVTGIAAAALPQTIELGFAPINHALAAEYGILLAIGILVAKLITTSFATASAMPGGLILPCMLVGAAAGAALGGIGQMLMFDGLASSPAFYALLCMGAMAGAVLHAPLTAMIILLELTGETSIVFPAMLTVITAVIVCRSQQKEADSIFEMLLKRRGLDYRNDPISQSLRRIGVISAMNKSVVEVEAKLSLPVAQEILEKGPQWLLIRAEQGLCTLLPAADAVRFINEIEQSPDVAVLDQQPAVDLLEIPAQRVQAASIQLRATLQDAHDVLGSSGAEALYVERQPRFGAKMVHGVLTREAIQGAYLR